MKNEYKGFKDWSNHDSAIAGNRLKVDMRSLLRRLKLIPESQLGDLLSALSSGFGTPNRLCVSLKEHNDLEKLNNLKP